MSINKSLVINFFSKIKKNWKWVLYLFFVFVFTLISIIFIIIGYVTPNDNNDLIVKQSIDTYISIGFSFLIISFILITSIAVIFIVDFISLFKAKKKRK